MASTQYTSPLLVFDAADPAGSTLRPAASEEIAFLQVEGQAVAQTSGKFLFSAETLPADAELTLSITFLDDDANYVFLSYPTLSGHPQQVRMERRGDGGVVTATFPLCDAALPSLLPNSTACLSIDRLRLCRVTITAGIAAEWQVPATAPAFAPQTPQNDLAGKGVAGYQLWFRAGEQPESWFHWGSMRNGRVHPCHEMFPTVEEYREQQVTLYRNGQAALGNGAPAEVFTSTDDGVIDTHFRWMKEYDLDGAAIQRFYSCIGPMHSTGRSTLRLIADKAEKYDRLFYVMYDFSGCNGMAPNVFLNGVQRDFYYNAEMSGAVSSPAYAHFKGRPIVCLWGISGDRRGRHLCGNTATELIRWFHERGYAVLVGTPDNDYVNRTGEDLIPFTMADIISPWTVGRYREASAKDWLSAHVTQDLAFCEKYGVEYQPVVFAGSCWTNMGNNGPINDFPHNAGQFLWTQAYQLKSMGVNNIYFAMFDEYDEGTAIMKGAADYFEIPTDQYYLTYATDGWWLSNDFYLRAAGAVIDMMQGKTPLRETIDIPHSLGPVYWRNSFESRETTYRVNRVTYTGAGQLDVCLNNPALLCNDGAEVTTAAISGEMAKSGQSAFRFAGTLAAGGCAVFRIAETAITAEQPLCLTYSLLAQNAGGEAVQVDLQFEGGERLSDTVALPRGVAGEWTTRSVSVPAGRAIVGVLVTCRDGQGAFDAFVDDIVLKAE